MVGVLHFVKSYLQIMLLFVQPIKDNVKHEQHAVAVTSVAATVTTTNDPPSVMNKYDFN